MEKESLNWGFRSLADRPHASYLVLVLLLLARPYMLPSSWLAWLARLAFKLLNTNEMKKWSSQLWLRFKQSRIKPEKCFRDFNGIRTHGLCVSAVVPHQLSYEDPYVRSRPICWIHRTRDRNETWILCELRTYKWNEDVIIAVVITI